MSREKVIQKRFKKEANYYNWMLSVRELAKSTAFERINTLK